MKRSIPIAAAFLALTVGCQDVPDDAAGSPESPAVEAPADSPDDMATDAAGEDAALLDPNEATREELLAIPGMGAEEADALAAGRPYDDMVAVDAILAEHMDEDERESIYEQLWKPLDLNNASGEEILLIPGVGDRMLHEFEEYRPYRGIAEFRREIGKYVDDETVARWERYVEVR